MLGFLTSCYPTKNIGGEEYLLLRNTYKIKGKRIKQSDVSAYYIQKTNRRVLGVRIYAQAYDFGMLFRDSSWMNTLFTKNIGEKPVVYDSNMVDKSFANIRQHLENNGYFNMGIKARITKYPGLKTAKVKYIIYPNEPYRIRKININIPESHVEAFVMVDFNSRLVREGDIFSVDDLTIERERLVYSLNNVGYYYFSKKQVLIEADSNLNDNKVDLTLKVLPMRMRMEGNEDSIVEVRNRRYHIKSITVYPELSEMDEDGTADTTVINYSIDNQVISKYIFIHKKDFVIDPKSIINAIYLKEGNFYRKDDYAESYRSLTALGIFRFINIQFNDVSDKDAEFGELECVVKLSRSARFALTTDTELKNTGGDLGVEQGFGFTSRNTFRNAEVLQVNLRGALEVQSVTNVSNPNNILGIFNTFETGVNVTLDIPRFLAPIRREIFSRYFRPKTRIRVGYSFQDRPDYQRTIIDVSYGYFWQPSDKINHILNPIEVSAVKIHPEPEFQQVIDQYQDPRIKYSYQDHMVLGMSYAFIFHEKIGRQRKPYQYFFGKIELGGIPYSSFSRMFGNPKDSIGQHWIGNLPYTQFIRVEGDYRYYLPAYSTNVINVFRFNFGIGIPLGGSVAIPFEKSFYIGGTNSMRAWVLGTLGPGSYKASGSTFEMTGDMRIELNYELRFDLGKSLEGAFFADAGNIWLIRENTLMPDGVFKFSTFIPQFALDAGFGLRYDLGFLVIRFDGAIPLYQPYRSSGDRWSVTNEQNKLIIGWNFAIGYPF
ncbi:MAG: BamA/TamA family outer membrane protein [Bacteroidales bacterium]|nr:BamA/TamA family outer membrane protein [Bacteroidales bacterium]